MMLVLIAFVAILIAGVVLEFRNNGRHTGFINLLLFAAVGMFLSTELTNESSITMYCLIGIVALNFLGSQVEFLKKRFIRVILPLISIGAYFLLFKESNVEFGLENNALANKFIILGSILAVLTHEIGTFKISILNKLLGGLDDSKLMSAFMLFMVGISIFLCMFSTGSFGLLVLAAVYTSTSFYRTNEDSVLNSSLLAIAVLPIVLAWGEGDIGIANGEMLEGLFIGGFSSYFLQLVWNSKSRTYLSIGIGYFAVLAISLLILYMDTVYAKLGGVDAFAAILVGFALVNSVVGKGYVGVTIFSLLLTGGALVTASIDNQDLPTKSEKQEMKIDIEAVEPGSMEEIVGSYKLIGDSSKISFVLGAKGENKGAFKKVNGTVNIAEELLKSSFDIELKMTDFTTFDEYQTSHLMEAEYFNASKFPTMKYESSSMIEKEDGKYELQGEFTMIGVTKELPVIVQREAQGDDIVLVGKGVIDRTMFGMTPSTSEGNIVDFTFRVVLE